MKNLQNRKQKGFTLIELVIVIVIIGILVTLAALKYADVTRTAKDKVAINNLRAVKAAILICQTENNGDLSAVTVDKIKEKLENKVSTAVGELNGSADGNGYKYTFNKTDLTLAVSNDDGKGNHAEWGKKGTTVEGTFYELK